MFREQLRLHVAVGSETRSEKWSISQVVEFSVKISLVVIVGHFVVEATHLGKLHCFVECNLCLCSTNLERRIPCSPVWAIEAVAKRVGMRECSIDDAGKGKPKYQFMSADSRQQLVLGKKGVISCVVQVEDGGKVAVLVRNRRQNTASSAAVFGRDEPVSVVAPNSENRKPRVVTAFRSQ